ncbi:hypothetical protein BC830DRAFT_1234324 [Chytriomyces sp. MP71]|nr:hypothetical protein BC830DRAFT_1234324 [Chytriomyces sp. MP71]
MLAGFNACFDRAISVMDGGQIASSGKGNVQYMWAYGLMSESVPQFHTAKGFVNLALFASSTGGEAANTTATATKIAGLAPSASWTPASAPAISGTKFTAMVSQWVAILHVLIT